MTGQAARPWALADLADLAGQGFSGPEEAIDAALNVMRDLLGVSTALVTRSDGDEWVATHVADAEFGYEPGATLSLPETLCSRIVGSTTPLVLNDVPADPDSVAFPIPLSAGVRTFIGVPLLQADGTLIGTLCALDRDLGGFGEREVAVLRVLARLVASELERAAAAAREGRERQEKAALLESTVEGVIGLDGDGRCTFVNPAAARMLGRSAEEMLGLDLHETAHHHRADGTPYPIADCPIFRACRGGPPARADEDVLWRRDGSAFPAEYSVAPLPGGGAVVAFADIVDRKRAEQERARLLAAAEQARGIAEAAVAARDQVLAAVSHDLRSPLAAVLGEVQLLRRRSERPDGPSGRGLPEGLERMEAAGERMRAMIDELLEVAALRPGDALALTVAPVDLVALTAGVVDEATRAAPDHPIAVEATDAALWVRGDPGRLRRALANLLANAVKYSPGGGQVTVAVRRDGSAATVTVRDRGIGVPESDLPHLFEPFRRGGNIPPGVAGSGLGLYGVLAVVEAHRGTVTVTSEEGQGSAFTVRLPLAPDAVSTLSPDTPAPHGVSSARGDGS